MSIDTNQIEKRLTALEIEMAQLKQQGATTNLPWWEKVVGVFENDEDFDNAMRLGREYRESLRPQTNEESEN